MFTKFLFFIFALTVFISCRTAGETVVNSQIRVETNQTKAETNVPQPVIKDKTSSALEKAFAKTFIVESKFDDAKGTIVYKDHLVEFKDDDLKGINIYVDGDKKASLKFETANPKVRTDFLDSNGERYFVLVIGAPGAGTCGDAIFAIVHIDEKLNVKISNPNEPDCQGELYSMKIENNSEEKDFSRQISIGELKFNLKTFKWSKESKK
jgi:hypothetical protein